MSGESTMPLAKELETFAKIYPSLKDQEGKFVVISGEEVLGTFETYNDALQEGYKLKGMTPFLVRQILPYQVTANYSRSLNAA